MKQCTKCVTWQEDSQFYAKGRWCKSCRLAYGRSNHAKKVKENNEYVAKKREQRKNWRKANPEAAYRLHRRATWKRQNIDPDKAEQYLTAHNGLCEICLEAPKTTPHVDHDHLTGNIRGILCAQCNHLLGMAKDSQRILIAAISYLNNK